MPHHRIEKRDERILTPQQARLAKSIHKGEIVLARLLFLTFLAITATAQAIAQQVPADFGSPEDCGLYRYKATIVRVYDGDTVWADIDLGFSTWRKNEALRLWGIDAPEVTGESRVEGLKVRDILKERIEGKQIFICTIKDGKENDSRGKYGRYLAILWDGNENVNDWLLRMGYAKPYVE